MKKHKVYLVILLVICILFISGCKDKNTYDIDTKSSFYKNSDIVTISFFVCGDTNEINSIKEAISLFEIYNPKIKVRLVTDNYNDYDEAFSEIMYRGNKTDIMRITYNDFRKHVNNDVFYDLDELSKIIDTNNIEKNILKMGKENNSLYGIPISLCSDFPIYNKTLLEKNRFETPTVLDDIKNYVKELRSYKIYPFGMDKYDTILWIISYYEQIYGFSPYDKEGNESINKAYLAEILTQYKYLADQKSICPINEYNDSLFLEGKVLGTIINSRELYQIEESFKNKNQSLLVGDYFKVKNNKHSGIYYVPSSLYTIDKKTSHPKEAALLLNFLLHNSECAKLLGTRNGVPASNIAEKSLIENGLLSECEFMADLSLDFNFLESNIRPSILEDEEYIDKCTEIINQLIDDKLTPIEAAQKIVEIK